MNNLLFVLLDGAPAAGAQSNPNMMWIMLGLMVVVFYFFMIRPQSKRQKELKNFRDQLKEGDKVVTTGGIHGKVAQIKDDGTILVEVDNNVRIKFDKNAILNQVDTTQPAK